MRSRACFPSSRTRSLCAKASPVMEARNSHTVQYSSQQSHRAVFLHELGLELACLS
jgi:hypothetical protein